MSQSHNVARDRKRHRTAIAATIALLIVSPSLAQQSCDARSPQTQFAHDDLQRAQTEADFAIAQDYAERSRRELKQLATSSENCGCAEGSKKFAAAAAQVGVALGGESRRELRDALKQAMPIFAEAMQRLKECSRR